MSDLVERLRDPKKEGACWCCQEAADEIERAHQSEREGWRYADELEQERKRLSAEVKSTNAAFEESDTACADLEDENKRLSAENERLKGVLAELKDALGLVSTEQTPVLPETDIQKDSTQNGNIQEPDVNVCPGCGGYADNGFSRSVPPDPYYCTKCEPVGDRQ